MNIVLKAADYSFKIYSLCVENYLYNFLFTFKVFKISILKCIKRLFNSFSIVLQLCKTLSKPYKYVVYIDNFFTNVKLYKTLKELEIEACRISKNKSEFPIKLLTL